MPRNILDIYVILQIKMRKRTKKQNEEIKTKYMPIFQEEGRNHVPPIQRVWVNKFINRYLASNNPNPIESEWKKYLKNKKGSFPWEFFVCASAKIEDNCVIIDSRYHSSLKTRIKYRNAEEIINDYCKEHELQSKKISDTYYRLGFHRTVPRPTKIRFKKPKKITRT